MKISIFLLSILAGVAGTAAAQSFNITAGELPDKIKAENFDKELILTGIADVRDLSTLRDLPVHVERIDLSGISIAELNAATPVYMGRSHFQGNRLPAYILFRSNAQEVILPESINIIDAGALAGSAITEITIPEGVSRIEDYAFYGCPNLAKVTLPASLKSIGKGAFANCPLLTSINIEDTEVTTIPEACFQGDSSLRELNTELIGNVGAEAFSATAIYSLALPMAERLAPFALAGMVELKEVSINKDAEFNKGTLMNNRQLVRIEGVPENIPDLFAANCIAYTPGSEATEAFSIGDYAFSNSAATSIILGANLISIGHDAFKGSERLTHINAVELGTDIPAVEDDAFDGLDTANISLKVADNTNDLWLAHPVWSQFKIYSDQSTSIESIADEQAIPGIKISLASGVIRVESNLPLTSANIYDASGAVLAMLPAGDTSAEINAEDIPGGVIIVKATNAKESKSVKIIK